MSVRRASANSNAVPTHSTFGGGVGIDSSPVAIAIAQAKVVEASVKSVVDCAIQILNDGKAPQNVPQGQFWTCAYSKTVLPQICQLREEFLRDCISSRRKVLQAIVLGALHGPLRKTRPSYFSNHCPRTFAPKPAYAVKYWKRHRMKPPNVDLLAIIRKRAERFLSVTLLRAEGMVLQRDSRKMGRCQLGRTVLMGHHFTPLLWDANLYSRPVASVLVCRRTRHCRLFIEAEGLPAFLSRRFQ
jgi:hypothetical protein